MRDQASEKRILPAPDWVRGEGSGSGRGSHMSPSHLGYWAVLLLLFTKVKAALSRGLENPPKVNFRAVLFSGAGDILWAEGIVMAGGSVVGGDVGARLSSHAKARVWTFRILVAVISLELVHLAWHLTAGLR